jgi:hypothetical protein
MAGKDIYTLVSGNGAFALDLYARLKTTGGNLFSRLTVFLHAWP